MKKLHIASAWLLILIILMVSAFSQNECVCTETLPWGIERIHANCVWDNNRDMVVDAFANAGNYRPIAVIDTGIDYYVDSAEHKVYHPDLKDNVAEGHGFQYDGIEVRIRDDHKDDDDHGTHVTGIIAAVDNEIGVIGTAPKARIFVLKYFSWQENAALKEIVAAIDWAVDNYIPIISISLGFSTDYAELRQACDNAYAQGVLLIAAAGNESGPVCYPAAYDSVIAVGAVDNNGQRWVESAEQGSNFGPELEFVAPGVNINSKYVVAIIMH
jgi:subtilisin